MIATTATIAELELEPILVLAELRHEPEEHRAAKWVSKAMVTRRDLATLQETHCR